MSSRSLLRRKRASSMEALLTSMVARRKLSSNSIRYARLVKPSNEFLIMTRSNAPFQFSQIDHIGAPVWDADSAITFFETADVPVIADEILEEYNVRAVFLDFDGVYLEFLEPTGPGNVKTFLEQHGNGYQHVAYRVPDIDTAIQSLRAAGVTFQSDHPLSGAGDARIIFVEEQHTSGFQIELVERA